MPTFLQKNVIPTECHTYKELKTLMSNKNLVFLRADKDSRTKTTNETDYITKIQTIIEEESKNGKYAETDDTTMQDLKRFQDFLRKSMNITMKCILKVMN